MSRVRAIRWLLWAGVVVVLLAATSPWLVSGYWRARSSNPVRRGLARAAQLGCFSCHGASGSAGIPIPGSEEGVPQWDVRRFILKGSSADDDDDDDEEHAHETAVHEHEHEDEAIAMPAYEDVVSAGDVDDLVAAFKVLSGMVKPAASTPARAGYDVAREWRCFSCHGPGGSGGLPNPGSFTGFIPGWYGAGFADLVRDRNEFDAWIREGTIPRLSGHPIAKHFLARQRVSMPAYEEEVTPEQLDGLWAYVQWLKETDGGHRAEIAPW
jgi:mono/diheme cytochrome c family protein